MAIEHKDLMELCLEHHNPESLYIEGINQYFFHNNPSKALDYLRQSAKENMIRETMTSFKNIHFDYERYYYKAGGGYEWIPNECSMYASG
ncbi:unnamed protein product [Brassica rapa subsp. trilocularis]|uniref:(rape) hypothetical protein n=1 Tax=Brassica napus TaxID=3708 RepID=A0A816U1B4_BRANA|nr:unnamed protein product [Brassica napus]